MESDSVSSWRSVTGTLLRARGELLWVGAGQVGGFVGAFATLKLLTALLGPAAFADATLALTIAGCFTLFLYGPLNQALLRFVSICREQGRLPALLRSVRRTYRAVSVAIAALAVGGLAAWLLGFYPSASRLVMLGAAYGVVSGLLGAYSTLLAADRMRRAVAGFQAIEAILRACLVATVLTLYARDVTVALLAHVVSAGVAAVWASVRAGATRTMAAARDGSAPPPVDVDALAKELVRYAWPFVIFAVPGAVSAYIDRWIAIGTLGAHEAGVYAALYQVANAPMLMVTGMATQVVMPVLFDRAGDGSSAQRLAHGDRLLDLAAGLTAGVMLAVVFAGYALGEPILRWLTSTEFAVRHALLWPILAGQMLFNLGQLLVLKGMVHNRPAVYLPAKIVHAVVLAAVGWLLSGRMGLPGLVAALGLSSVLYLAWIAVVNRRLSRERDALGSSPGAARKST